LEVEAHSRKCLTVKWHPAAENVFATHSVDKTVKLWDLDNPDDPACTFTDLPDYLTSIDWSHDGKMIGGMAKNKHFVAADPRTQSAAFKFPSHPGPKQQRCAWIDSETVVTSGFDKEANR